MFFVPALPKEVIEAMIAEGNLKTVGDLHSYLKDMSKDALQEMLEVEVELGYSRGINTINRLTISVMVIHKTVKTQFRKIQIEASRDRNSEFEPIVVPKNKRDISGIEE